MDDLISRRAAIDALRVAYWDDNIQSAKDDPCIVDAMTDWAIRQVKALPSAQPGRCEDCENFSKTRLLIPQPEIIRCKDCRWGKEVCGNIECFADTNVPSEYHGYDWFCPNGERETDE